MKIERLRTPFLSDIFPAFAVLASYINSCEVPTVSAQYFFSIVIASFMFYTQYFLFISAIRRGRPTKYSYLSRSSKSFTSQYDLITLLTQLERSTRAAITAAPNSPNMKSSPSHKVWTLFTAALKWVQHVPMFANLDICEQYSMLRCCWSDLFILIAAQYDLQIDSVALAYEIDTCTGMCNERKLRLKQTLANFHECLLRLRGLEEAEYACLRVMVLFSSGEEC